MKRITLFLTALAAVLLLAAPTFAQDADSPLITISSNEQYEAFLAGPDGMTLYMFTPDDANCVDGCLANWPPLYVESEDELTKAEGIPGELGTYERDGQLQVTYNGMPLYYWVNDEASGDITGDKFNGVWFIVEPTLLYVGGNEELGKFIVGPNGMTLYLFTPDDANCVDGCLANWPPLYVESEDELTKSRDLAGELGVYERDDQLQVTYNGAPLYYWVNDEAIGDATGQNVNDVWFVVHPETVVLSSSEELGDFLVGPEGFTLYLFAIDEEGASSCVDACAENWPPLTVAANEVLTAGESIEGELATIEREDGTLQVTYNGVPLYYWVNDAAPGDTTGHEVNDVWFVVAP